MAVDLRQDFTYFHHVGSILKMNKLDTFEEEALFLATYGCT